MTERKNSGMKILVTGGAGYIGGFMTKELLDRGNKVVVADSLERGHKEAVDTRATLAIGDLTEKRFLQDVLGGGFDMVLHFAGYIAVGESMKDPNAYFKNNTFATLQLLETMKDHGIGKIIFSSTAAIYGNPIKIPIPEDHQKIPTNPYGESKLMTEKLLHWYQQIYDISYVALRYFNACGAALDGSMGEAHDPETHVIPNAINAALNHARFNLFGDDYDTPDGTCVRDYIHVLDLIYAHVLAIEKLQGEKGGFAYNVGTGTGFSNKQIIEIVKKVSGIDFEVAVQSRRPGDADELVADPKRIQKELGFRPNHSDLQTIVESAWKWHTNKAGKE